MKIVLISNNSYISLVIFSIILLRINILIARLSHDYDSIYPQKYKAIYKLARERTYAFV